jgi:hypothetical protein
MRVLSSTASLPAAAPVPMPGVKQGQASKTVRLPETGPLRAAAAPVPAPMPVPAPAPLAAPSAVPRYTVPLAIVESEEISPFTGNLPAVAKPAASPSGSKRFQPRPQPQGTARGRSSSGQKLLPASARLPAINVNSKEKRPLRNLWSYGDRRPVVTNHGGGHSKSDTARRTASAH